LQVIRHSGLCKPTIARVALCTGGGAGLAAKAVRAGADIYIASDFKYNDFIDADGRIIVADIGHFESEDYAIDLLYDVITKKLPTFAVRKSERS
ncbi:MAG: Nif3-like dinuclear metal center hexameric protein, partial [Alistipes sp.]|nr:Nif3-like dinuclear metal center hexameric protein [Alistipes sp.]